VASTEALFAAIEAGDAEAVRALVAADPRLASARDGEGVSALLRARYRADRAITAAHMAAGPDLDVFEAAAFGDLDRLAFVGADPSAPAAVSADGFTPLHLAAFFGQTEAAALLLARGAEVDARGRGWMTGTPLHSAASGRHAAIVRLLLEAGADPDARQSSGWTPLHAAAHNGDLATVELLLGAGADPRALNDEGASVLELAREGGDGPTIARIREAQAP
jgi:ankyrin repeat protein